MSIDYMVVCWLDQQVLSFGGKIDRRYGFGLIGAHEGDGCLLCYLDYDILVGVLFSWIKMISEKHRLT
jgi:hypothetical protein